MSDLRNKIESGNYTPDDILDWYERNATSENVKLLQNQPRENFESIEEFEDDGVIYTIGTENGISVILDQKKKPEIFGVGLTEAQIGGLQVKQQLNTAGDIAKKTPGFLGETLNPINLAKGVNKGVKNAFGLVDELTGGAVTKLDNYLVENFPNTLGKKFDYEKPQTAGSMTGEIIGQYVITDLLLRRAFPFFNKNLATGIAADATTVGLFSSADEGNLASLLGMFLPESEDPGAIAKAITSLEPDADDSEIQGRLKNVVIDTGALGAILSFFKVAKGLISNPKVTNDLVQAQSAGAAATPKEAPTAVEVVDSAGQPIKQADQVVQSEKPFYSNVENTISNFTFKQQPGNQILATLNNTAGIKQSEIQDLGLDTFLKDNPSVTKEQLDDFIADKSLTTRVKDEILEGTRDPSGDVGDINFAVGFEDTRPDILTNANSLEDAKLIVNNNEELYSDMLEYGKARGLSDDDIMTEEFLEDFLKEQFGITQTKPQTKPTKFGDYVTPGGENYKEMLITAPGTPQVFTDHHYRGEVPAGENLIAHARFNDRTIDGNKILFIEEIQSDLHQAGRKQGYRSQKNIDAIRGRLEQVNERIDFYTNKVKKSGKDLEGSELDEANALLEERGRLKEFINNDIKLVADAPFKKNWYELTMKRIIKYAIDNGYDGISFTTGMMQVRRYPGMQNPEGLKGFYDNTLTDSINKFGKKYGAKLERTNINDGTELYRYTNDDVQEALDFTYDTVNQRGEIFASYKVEETSIPGERYQLVQIKNGKENIIYSQDDLDLVKDILADELDGFKVPQIKQDIKGSEVPLLIFPQNMKNEILTEGVPIAQVEERDKSTAVV